MLKVWYFMKLFSTCFSMLDKFEKEGFGSTHHCMAQLLNKAQYMDNIISHRNGKGYFITFIYIFSLIIKTEFICKTASFELISSL